MSNDQFRYLTPDGRIQFQWAFDISHWSFPPRCGGSVLHLDILVAVARAAGAEPGIDEAVEIAVEHALRVARAHAGAQVLHHLVGLEHVTANLAAPPYFALLAVKPFHLRALLVEFLFVEAGLEDVQRRGLVLDLRALVLADDDDATWDVREPHGGVRRIHALAALAGGTVNVGADFVLRDLDLNFIGDFGDDIHGAEGGVAALVRIERADAHEPVHAALGLGVAVGILAPEQHRCLADAGLVARLHVL